MLKIRLARIGKKKKPIYRIAVAESSRDLYGRLLEVVGRYNPLTKVCEVKKDRVEYWISKGAKLSPTLHNLFIDQNVIKGEKVRAYSPKKKAQAEEASEKKPEAKPEETKQTEAPAEPAKAPEVAAAKESPKSEEKKEEVKEEKPAEEPKQEEKK